MTKQTWQDIYSAGGQLNRYPYDFIVSNFYRYRPVREDGSVLTVLDLGCGAGNHSLFCAENGAKVLAVDYSPAALDVVSQRAAERGLSDLVTTRQVDFEDFDLDEGGFDVMIDRLAVSHVGMDFAIDVYDRVHELMNENGIVLSNLFTTGHGHKDFGRYDEQNRIWHGFEDGIFEHLKTACFYSEDEIRYLFRRFCLLSLVRETQESLPVGGDNETEKPMEIWKVIAKKNG